MLLYWKKPSDTMPEKVVLTESVTTDLEIVRSLSSPKVIVSVKIVADLDKIDNIPEMCVKAVNEIYAEASKQGLGLGV